MTLKKTKLVLGITTAIFALSGAVVSTEAAAKTHKKAHKHKTSKVHKTHKTSYSKNTSHHVAPEYVAPAPVAAASYDDSALKQRIAELENRPAPVAPARTKDNMVFFRGGWAHANNHRDGVSINSQVVPVGAQGVSDKDAWYFGAGLDFSVDDNLFGLMNNTEVLGEVMFEYKEFSNHVNGNALANNPSQLAGGAYNPRTVTVSQFSLAASPKIKFMKGSDFRPWIIPVGFNLDVVSPPTASITVLQPGMMFGLGADYRVWKNIYVGADARYHQALGRIDGVSTNGFTAGGYIGLGF